MNIKRMVLVNGVMIVVAALVFVYWVLPGYLPDTPEQETQYGSLGGDFELTSIDGPVSLSDFEGEAVLLFFGFTHCPDYCLAALAVQRQVLSELPEDYQGRVTSLFVSVDPDRDDLQTLADYTDFFHEDIIGVTGPKDDIDRITAMYGASYSFVDLEDSELEYTVEHSTRTYLIGPDGKVRDLFEHDAPYTQVVERIQEVL